MNNENASASWSALAVAAAAYRSAMLAAYRSPHKTNENSHEYVALLEARDAAEARMLAALARVQEESRFKIGDAVIVVRCSGSCVRGTITGVYGNLNGEPHYWGRIVGDSKVRELWSESALTPREG